MKLPHSDVYGTMDRRRTSLRVTPIISRAMEIARTPVATEDLVTSLGHTSQTARPQIERLVERLHQLGVLIALPMMPEESRQYANLLKELGGAAERSHIADLFGRPEGTWFAGPVARDRLRTIQSQQKRLLPEITATTQVDSLLSAGDLTLSKKVASAVAEATQTLIRLSDPVLGWRHLDEYAGRFMERYGIHAEVPIFEVLDPHIGLDAPLGYTEPPPERPLSDTKRPEHDRSYQDRLITSWVIDAVRDCRASIELTDAMIAEYQIDKHEGRWPALVETYVELVSESTEAIDRGEFEVWISPSPIAPGGRTFGRFLDLMGDGAKQRLSRYLAEEERLYGETVFAELSYVPLLGRMMNLNAQPRLRRFAVAVNTASGTPNQIDLRDLRLCVDKRGLFLRADGVAADEVIVDQGHMLNYLRAPNACRLALEVSDLRRGGLSRFTIRGLEDLPFCPRFTRRNVVLRPSQWMLSASDLSESSRLTDGQGFYKRFQAWRARNGVPRYAYLGDYDERLLLDLDSGASVEEVRRELASRDVAGRKRIKIRETPVDPERTWLRDASGAPFVSELVIPLVVSEGEGSRARKNSERGQRSATHADARRAYAPGSEWTSMHLFCSPSLQDSLLDRLEPVMIDWARAGKIDGWFFIRYANPDPHLRLRVRQHQTDSDIVARLASLGSQLLANEFARDFALVSYCPEVERYGGFATIRAAEDFFVEDSVYVANMLRHLRTGEISVDREMLGVLAIDHLATHWGLGVSAKSEIAHVIANGDAWKAEPQSRKAALANAVTPWAHGDPAVARQALLFADLSNEIGLHTSTVAGHIQNAEQAGLLALNPTSVLLSLVHMRLNRLFGIDRDFEARLMSYWGGCLTAVAKRPSA